MKSLSLLRSFWGRFGGHHSRVSSSSKLHMVRLLTRFGTSSLVSSWEIFCLVIFDLERREGEGERNEADTKGEGSTVVCIQVRRDGRMV